MGVPVATPVGLGDWRAAVSALFSRGDCRTTLERKLCDLTGSGFVGAASSGRAALFYTLQAMKRFQSRDEVIVPAFVCPSVARAVLKAGLKPVVCDVGPHGSGLDAQSLESVISGRALAVIAAHLYGYTYDLTSIAEQTRACGAMLIEDAAQAFGAMTAGRNAGTIGDAGIFSFGMSKVLWGIGGGAVTTSHPDLAANLAQALSQSVPASKSSQLAGTLKMGLLAMLLRSHHLGPLDSIWGSRMRGKDDLADFTTSCMPEANAAAACSLLGRLADITAVRARNANYFSTHLSDYSHLTLPAVAPGSAPVFLRYPIVIEELKVKKDLLARLRRNGINASEMYTRDSYEGVLSIAARRVECPRSEYLCDHMLNLPTHSFLSAGELTSIVEVFHNVCGHGH
jgi:perosamine synthetase